MTVEVSSKDIERACDIAHMAVPYGFYVEDYRDMEKQILEITHTNLIDEALLQKDRTKAFLHLYINPRENPAEAVEFLSSRYKNEQIPHSISISSCEEDDWLNSWKQYFFPIPIGDKLLIRPTWREQYDAGNRKVLSIDPGAAFGTGSHETTRLCLEMIEIYLKPDHTVLDIGCGSGILSIAGALLGAREVVGIDIDQMAVKIAKENIKINNVSNKVEIIQGNLINKINKKYDIIIANIAADAIISLNGSVGSLLHSGSVYIMSGIINTRLHEVMESLDSRFRILRQEEQNGWICIAANKDM